MHGFVTGHSGVHSCLRGSWRYLHIKTGEKLSEKLLWDGCIPLWEMYLFSHKAVLEHCSCKTEKVRFCSALKTMAKSEISENKTQKEAFKETALRHVHSFHRGKAYSTLLSLEFLSLRNPWKNIKWHSEACGGQGNVFCWKLERSFLSNCFVMFAFIS